MRRGIAALGLLRPTFRYGEMPMAGWSMPMQPPGPRGPDPAAGWKLRALTGRALGKEFDLPLRRYILGSRSPAKWDFSARP